MRFDTKVEPSELPVLRTLKTLNQQNLWSRGKSTSVDGRMWRQKLTNGEYGSPVSVIPPAMFDPQLEGKEKRQDIQKWVQTHTCSTGRITSTDLNRWRQKVERRRGFYPKTSRFPWFLTHAVLSLLRETSRPIENLIQNSNQSKTQHWFQTNSWHFYA